MLSNWNTFPSVQGNRQYLFSFYDSLFGEIPFRVFVPKTYNKTKRIPLLLLLHGAVGGSSFDQAKDYLDSSSAVSKDAALDPLFNFFSKKDYIILMPIGDRVRKFDWSSNRFAGFADMKPATNRGINATYKTLARMISLVKASFNVDDNHVFAMGHSDGADGAFCLELMQPNQFGAFVIYNSMLLVLNARNLYLRNLQNVKLYVVHSSKDNLRPIEQTREIIQEANVFLRNKIAYREYQGFQHFDRHLTIDPVNAERFLENSRRDPYPSDVYRESDNSTDNRCAWLSVAQFNVLQPKSSWQIEFGVKSYDPGSKTFSGDYYGDNDQSYAIKGHYENNLFTIFTSRVQSFDIYIDPTRVNITRPVTVEVNGKQLFHDMIIADKAVLVKTFGETFDRSSISIAAIKVVVGK